MEKTSLVNKANRENVENLVMLERLVTLEDKVKRVNQRNKIQSLAKRVNEASPAWSDYLVDQEHQERKENLAHPDSMASME
jgi:hypothetical protein